MPLSDHNKPYNAAIYIRLSKEDGDKMESNSVSNQRRLIESFLKNKPDIVVRSERVDDGYSGVSFDRPAVRAMLEDIRAGIINCVVVKDLSRFGRNYIETGRYIEQVFPFLGVRFIAINDGFDSASQHSWADDMILPFKNLINDAYSRDISMKVRSGLHIRCKQGDYIGAFPLYGYVRSEEDKHKLAVDDFAAMTIRDIFRWKMEGMNSQRIARRLNAMGVLSPLEYKRMLGWAFSTSFQLQPVAKWSAASVTRILKNEIYTGTMIQGRESSPNYKITKKFRKPPSEWLVVPNTHDAIVSKADFALVQRLMAADTRTAPEHEKVYLFSGMVQCGACRHNMIRKPVQSGGRTYVYYVCRTQKTAGEKCGNQCRIRETKLRDCVLQIIQSQISMACAMDEIMAYMDTLPLKQAEVQKVGLRIQRKQEEYTHCQNLMFELYEDYKKGIVSKDNYIAWKANYEEHCQQVTQAMKVLGEERINLLKNRAEQSKWIDAFKQHQNLKELTRPALVTLVRKIVVIDKNTLQVHFAFRNEYESIPRLSAATEQRKVAMPKPCKKRPITPSEAVV